MTGLVEYWRGDDRAGNTRQRVVRAFSTSFWRSQSFSLNGIGAGSRKDETESALVTIRAYGSEVVYSEFVLPRPTAWPSDGRGTPFAEKN